MIRRLLGRIRRRFGEKPRPPLRRGLLFGPVPAVMPSSWGEVTSHPRYREAFEDLSSTVTRRRGWTPVPQANIKPPQFVTHFERVLLSEVLHQLAQLAVVHAEGIEYHWVGGISLGELVAGAAAGAYSAEDAITLTIAAMESVLVTEGRGDLVLVPPAHLEAGRRLLGEHSLVMQGTCSLVLGIRTDAIAQVRAAVPGVRPVRLHVLPHSELVDLAPVRAAMASRAARHPAVPLYLSSAAGRLEGAMDETAVSRISGSVAYIGDVLAAISRAESGEVVHIASVVLNDELEAAGIARGFTCMTVDGLLSRADASRHPARLPLEREEFRRDPHVSYERCRHADLTWIGPRQAVTLSHAATQDVLKRAEVFSSSPNVTFPVLHGADGDDHARRRRVLVPYFTPQLQRARAASLRVLAADVAAELRPRESFQLVRDFALPVPRRATCEWLGLREAAVDALLALPAASLRWDDVEPLLTEGGLLRTLRADGALSDGETAQLAPFLLMAGLTTVTDFVVNAVCALHERPVLLARLRADATLLPAVVDELLRLEPPVHALPRLATSDTEVAGVPIPAGTIVNCSYGAANRDPRSFAEPNAVDLERTSGRSLTFGFGAHFCLGATAGREFAHILLETLLFGLSDFAPCEDVRLLIARHAPQFAIRRRVPDIEFARARGA